MALSDPQSVTIATVAHTLPRVPSQNGDGVFRKEDGTIVVRVVHSYNRRVRHTIRLDHSKMASDPVTPSLQVRRSASAMLTLDAPPDGYTNAELRQLADAIMAWATASSGANLVKVLGGEA